MSENTESIVDLVQKHKAADAGNLPSAEPSVQPEVQRKAAQMSESMPADKMSEEALEKLLVHVKHRMAWQEISLPSQGLLYPNGEAKVSIRPFTFDDERILKSMEAAKDPDAVIEKLLRNCVKGIAVEELTPHDRVYCLFRLRGISYGDEYPIQHDCNNCSKASKLSLTISTLDMRKLTPEHMKFRLPDSEQDAIIKLPRSQDEHLYRTPELLMNNLHMFVYSVGGITDKTILEAFLHKTTVRDIDTLRSHIFTPDYGMENHFFYTCTECNTKNRVEIGLNESFFTAS